MSRGVLRRRTRHRTTRIASPMAEIAWARAPVLLSNGQHTLAWMAVLRRRRPLRLLWRARRPRAVHSRRSHVRRGEGEAIAQQLPFSEAVSRQAVEAIEAAWWRRGGRRGLSAQERHP